MATASIISTRMQRTLLNRSSLSLLQSGFNVHLHKTSSLRVVGCGTSLLINKRQTSCTFSTSTTGSSANFSSSSLSSSSSSNCLSTAFVAALQSALPQLEISTNKYERERHGKGESYHPTAPPSAVLTPSNTQEVVEIVKLCQQHRVPLIPFGVGTSVEGHVCALDPHSVSLDMTKMNDIQIRNLQQQHQQDGDMNDTEGLLQDPFVMVGAGVTRKTLNESLRHTGMQFMVDPGADATIGGMVACGASGTTAVHYGTMRENILGLECVLADGTVANCGTLALKSSAGYDLTSLMTGSEGTLGVITRITVKLHPIQDHVVAGICVFEDLENAAAAVAAIKMCGINMTRCELLDSASVAAFNQYKKGNMEENPTLFLEFSGPSLEFVKEQASMSEDICVEEYDGEEFKFTSNEEERADLWAARHQLYYAAIASRPGATKASVTDACVPLSKFAEAIAATAQDVQELGVVGPCFGHAGDGNFHCVLPRTDDDTEEYTAKVEEVNDRLIRRALEVGGTCTGEHGIGYGKTKYLEKQYGPGTVHMMGLVKKALDPNNIMNPGKIVQID